jgi:hypothetical protein
LRDSNLTHVRTYAVLEVERLELEGSYRMEGRGGGAWAWIGADTIHSKVIFKTCISVLSRENIRLQLLYLFQLYISLFKGTVQRDGSG